MKNIIKNMALVGLLAALAACGGSDTTTTNTTTGGTTDDTPVDPVADVPSDKIGLGLGVDGAYQNGVAGTGLSAGQKLSPSGTTTVTVNLVNLDANNEEFLGLRDVFFISTCTQVGLAEFTPATVKASGIATATYKDKGCGKTSGTTDNVVVYVGSVDSEGNIIADATARTTIDVSAAKVGAIQYISASPSTIALSGFGTEDTPSLSTLQFQVVDQSGNAMPDRKVRFGLDHEFGNAALSLTEASTDQEGKVVVILNAGNASGSIRVKAEVDILDENDVVTDTITTLSIPVVMATSLGDQNSFTLSANLFNPAAWTFSGSEVDLTVHLADHYQNPVLDGTTVYFRATGGLVEPSCETKGGVCSVTWISSNPRPVDGYVTVTAYTRGQGDYQDGDGDGLFDLGESFTTYGEGFIDANGNGTFELDGVYQSDLDVDNDGINEFAWSTTAYRAYVDQDGTPSYSLDNSNFFEEFIDSNGNGSLDLNPPVAYQGVNCTDEAVNSAANHCAEQIDLVRSLRLEMSNGIGAYFEGPFLWDSYTGRYDTSKTETCIDASIGNVDIAWRVSDSVERRNHLPKGSIIELQSDNISVKSVSGNNTLPSFGPVRTLPAWDAYWLAGGSAAWEAAWDARYNLRWANVVANIGRTEANRTADRNAYKTANAAELSQDNSDAKKYEYLASRGHIVAATVTKPDQWIDRISQLILNITTVKGAEVETLVNADIVGFKASLIENSALQASMDVSDGAKTFRLHIVNLCGLGLDPSSKLIINTTNGILSGVVHGGGASGVDSSSASTAQLSIGNSIEATEVTFTITSDGTPNDEINGFTVSYLVDGLFNEIVDYTVKD